MRNIKATAALSDGCHSLRHLAVQLTFFKARSLHSTGNTPSQPPVSKKVLNLWPFFLRDHNTLKDIALLDRLLSCTRRTAKLSSKAMNLYYNNQIHKSSTCNLLEKK
jgi:hypothetical protein